MRRSLWVIAVALALVACSGGGDDDDDASADDATSATASPNAEDDLGDGTHFGLVTALDPVRAGVVFDRAELLEGAEAASAAESDGGALTEGGSYVRNPDHGVSRVAVSDAAIIRLIADECCDLEEVSFEDWLAGFDPGDRQFYGTASSYYEITVEDGEVVAVDELMVP